MAYASVLDKRKAQHRYEKTPAGKATLHRYRISIKGRTRNARYDRTEKGRKRSQRYYSKPEVKEQHRFSHLRFRRKQAIKSMMV
jgi:hypothetical protein